MRVCMLSSLSITTIGSYFGGLMEFWDGVRVALNGVVCTGAQAGGWVSRKLSAAGIPTEGIQRRLDKFQLSNCGADPSNLPEQGEPPPFTGGQCPGQSYLVTYEAGLGINAPADFRQYSGTVSVPGPILRIEWIETPGRVECFIFGESSPVAIGGRSGSNLPPIRTAEIISVAPQSGQSDDCGNLPGPEIPPEPENTEDVDVTWDVPGVGPVTWPDVPVTFYPPCVNFPGVSIPFEMDTPIGPICGRIGLELTLVGQVAPTIEFTDCPGDKTDKGVTSEDLSDFFDLGDWVGDPVTLNPAYTGTLAPVVDIEAPPILGVFVEAQEIPNLRTTTGIILEEDNSPRVNVPYIGLVHFEALVLTGEADASGQVLESYQSAFVKDEPIKSVSQLVICPWEFGAASVRVSFENGWEGRYRVIRRKSCCSKCSENDLTADLDNFDRCI